MAKEGEDAKNSVISSWMAYRIGKPQSSVWEVSNYFYYFIQGFV
jgi:hypothetical protein